MKNIFLFLLFLFSAGLVRGADTFSIKLNNSSPVQYCTDPVLVAQYVTIAASFQITGMTVSFSQGFIPGEDELIYSKPAGSNIVGTWSAAQGNLVLQGDVNSTLANYQEAIRLVKYKNNKSIPVLSTRKISITLMNADYLPDTQHFYKYIARDGISWSTARLEAEASNYFGLKGYLATITSAVENAFILMKTNGVGWIGASDQSIEGEWRWVTGPEGLEDNGKGKLFWTTAGTVSGQYTNWNSGEPNDCCDANIAHQEDFAHILHFANTPPLSQRWNDLPNSGGSGDYFPRGYLIEFGDKPDVNLELSATLDLQVNTMLFKTGTISAICSGDTVRLNTPDSGPIAATYSWTPASTLSSPTAANPVARPVVPTTYTVVGTRGICVNRQDFIVPVNPKPSVGMTIDSLTCYGFSLDVGYKGNANLTNSKFTWVFGSDTIANAVGRSNVTFPLGIIQPIPNLTLYVQDQNKCSDQYTERKIHVKPFLSQWKVLNPDQCLYKTFDYAVTNPDASIRYDWNFGDGTTGTGPETSHKYKNAGDYDINLTVTNSTNCSNSAVIEKMVNARPVPVASFTMSDSIVYKDRPNVDFTNTSTGSISQVWNFGDYATSQEISPSHSYKTTGRDTVLLVIDNEYLCSDSVTHNVLVAFGQIFPPTAFSPNAPNPVDRIFKLDTEGVNDEGYHFWVMSRWDDLIYNVQHRIEGWDGKMENGSFAPPGVYVWRLIFIDFLGDVHRQSGTVTLIY